MIIRKEKTKEYNTVNLLVKEAFLTSDHSNGREHVLVEELRDSDAFIPELSLVAEIDGAIAGHVMFTKGFVGDEPILILAPVSVAYSMKNHGIGGALILEGHRIAKELGYHYIAVVGSNKYFPRLGYHPAKDFGIEPPKGIQEEYFQVIQLDKHAPDISGVLKYPKPFGL